MSAEGSTLFDPDYGLKSHQRLGSVSEAKRQADQAIRAVEAAGDPEWADTALECVYRVAERLPYFHVDEVWEDAALRGTVDDRAMGAVLRKAARRGWIVKTDRVKASKRSHGSGKPIWRSLLWVSE